MKLQELDLKELTETNGGQATKSAIGFSSSMGTGSLLSLTFETTDGEKSNSTTLSVGNNLYFFLGGFGSQNRG